MVLGRRARVVWLCLLAHAGLARELTGPMLQLPCDHTHRGESCAPWGGRDTESEGRCAAYPGEPVGWCWVDRGHSEWQFCEQACTGLGSAGAQWDLRDAAMFPSLNAAVAHLHRRRPDVDASVKLLSSAVAQARADVQEYWENAQKGVDVGPPANDLAARPCAARSKEWLPLADTACGVAQATRTRRRTVVESAHSGFLLATLVLVRVQRRVDTHAARHPLLTPHLTFAGSGGLRCAGCAAARQLSTSARPVRW